MKYLSARNNRPSRTLLATAIAGFALICQNSSGEVSLLPDGSGAGTTPQVVSGPNGQPGFYVNNPHIGLDFVPVQPGQNPQTLFQHYLASYGGQLVPDELSPGLKPKIQNLFANLPERKGSRSGHLRLKMLLSS